MEAFRGSDGKEGAFLQFSKWVWSLTQPYTFTLHLKGSAHTFQITALERWKEMTEINHLSTRWPWNTQICSSLSIISKKKGNRAIAREWGGGANHTYLKAYAHLYHEHICIHTYMGCTMREDRRTTLIFCCCCGGCYCLKDACVYICVPL